MVAQQTFVRFVGLILLLAKGFKTIKVTDVRDYGILLLRPNARHLGLELPRIGCRATLQHTCSIL